jgi:Transglutaminase-like superfamily
VVVSQLRAAGWTVRSAVSARRQLRRGVRPDDILLPRLPRLPEAATTTVRRVTRLLDNTCLERAVVLQTWYAAHGDKKVVWIGVSAPARGFKAHAWLDGEECARDALTQLMKIEPR